MSMSPEKRRILVLTLIIAVVLLVLVRFTGPKLGDSTSNAWQRLDAWVKTQNTSDPFYTNTVPLFLWTVVCPGSCVFVVFAVMGIVLLQNLGILKKPDKDAYKWRVK